MKNTENAFRRLWGIPLLMGILTIIGLLSALLGDGFWDMLSWCLLGSVVVLVIFYIARAERKRI